MVMSEVSKDPPSPFVTVQSAYDGVSFPSVPPPALEQQQHQSGGAGAAAGSSSSSWSQQPAGVNGAHAIAGPGSARTHLQSIVSQQSLNFNTPPDSPLEFEHALNSIAASSAAAAANSAAHASPVAAAAAGNADLAAVLASAQQQQPLRDTPAAPPGDSSKHHKVLRLLGGSWLRQTQSVPHCSPPHKAGHPSAQQQQAAAMLQQQQQELSFKQIHSVLDKQDVAQDDLLHSQLQPLGGNRKLKTRVHKLLAWASGRVPSLASSPAASPQVQTAPLGGCGSLTFVPGASSHHHHQQQQQQPGVPIPWQHQVFSNDLSVQPSVQASVQPLVQRISSTGGTPAPLRSPRSSLVSCPSSCDCPLLVGRYSSTGSDGGYARSPGYATTCSSVGCSQSCSLTTTPSPGKALAAGAAAAVVAAGSGGGASTNGISANGSAPPPGAAAAGAEVLPKLRMSPSIRAAHHRHRQHKPTCRFYQQQQGAAAHGGQLQTPGAGGQLAPTSPSTGGLMPQSSLRTALQQLETMASVRAARIKDKLNAGLQRMTSHRVFDGVFRHGVVGREVMRDWELGPTLGLGASCVTRLVTDKTTGRTAACKSISKQGILHSPQVKAAMLAVQREVAIMQAVVGHPHAVTLHAVYEDVHNLHMVMDWCGGGNVWELMERCPGYMLPEPAAAAATLAVLRMLAHCHSRGVMHRDIKPDNLLIAAPLEDPTQLTAEAIKVNDFGISVPFTPGQVLTEVAGTMGYMAPELLKRCYTEAADVWSAGVMLYEMVAGQLPFSLGNTVDECLVFIEEGEVDLSVPPWQAASPEARELVAAMLVKDPALRPSAQKLLDNYGSWLSKGCQPTAAAAQQS